MTSVIASKKGNTFTIELTGHATGEDPKVCTAISTLICSLELYCANHDVKYECKKDPGNFSIRFTGDEKECNAVYEFVVYALYQIQHDFAGYIEVKQA